MFTRALSLMEDTESTSDRDQEIKNDLSNSLQSEDPRVAKLQRLRLEHKGAAPSRRTLLQLVLFHKDAKCCNFRDKIFVVHSLAPDCCSSAVQVDYKCSAYTLCTPLLIYEMTFCDARSNFLARSYQPHELILRGCALQHGSENSFDLGEFSPAVWDGDAGLSSKLVKGYFSHTAFLEGKPIILSPLLPPIPRERGLHLANQKIHLAKQKKSTPRLKRLACRVRRGFTRNYGKLKPAHLCMLAKQLEITKLSIEKQLIARYSLV